MKTIEISEELYERLKNFVVDPFDDSPEIVVNRMLDIVEKARGMWSSWEDASKEADEQAQSQSRKAKKSSSGQEHVGIAL